MKPSTHYALRARRLGIDTLSEPMIFLRKDCPVCRSEGFSSLNRVALRAGGKSVIATLYQTDASLLGPGEAGLSDAAWTILALKDGAPIHVQHAASVESLADLRGRIFGHALTQDALDKIIQDIVQGRYRSEEH